MNFCSRPVVIPALTLVLLFFATTVRPQNKRRTSGSKSAPVKPLTQVAPDQDENSASLQETIDWITVRFLWTVEWKKDGDKFGAAFYKGDIQPTPTLFLKNDGCSVRFKSEDFGGFAFTLKLSDIDPVSVKVIANAPFHKPDYFVFIPVSTGKPPIQMSEGPKLWDANAVYLGFKEDQGNFNTMNMDISNRAVRAFQHAVKLCGGKVEPF